MRSSRETSPALRAAAKRGFLVLVALIVLTVSPSWGDTIRIDWDRSTLTLLQRGGGYPRMTRLSSGLLCCFERRGSCCVRKSVDEGKTWQDAVKVADYPPGAAANPELLACADGTVLLFFNGRPRDGTHPYTIGIAISHDQGATWTANPQPLYTAGTAGRAGCYEPAAIQLHSGEIELFFANEFPYKNGDQEISLMRSTDNGKTWSTPRTASFRRGGRDGMPVPIVLHEDRGIAVAIEDNGLTKSHRLLPVVVSSPDSAGWTKDAVTGNSDRRWGAVDVGWPDSAYAGAPYLRQLTTGECVLSCQSDQDRGIQRMVVYIGDASARHFAGPSEPFPLDTRTKGLWNSLFVKNRDTITAMSTTTINGTSGVWAIDGHIIRN